MTEMNWMKQQEERIESSIKMHENCLTHAKEELDVLRKIISHLEGLPNNMNRPKNQSNKEVRKEMPTENENLREIVERIACKCATLVEARIDNTQNGLTGTDLREIYDGIQMLGHITATLERFSRMENVT